jgi:L-amino acid N-acyltransferase YncA
MTTESVRDEPGTAFLDVGPVRIIQMTSAHGPEVLAIYQAGIDEGDATFETRAPDWTEFNASKLADHRFVAVSDEVVLGWIAITSASSRDVYSGVVEHSVYVHPDARGRGVGRLLMMALISATESAGIWTIQSGIFPENIASLALHQSVGFRIIGTRERVGRHHDRWRDSLLLERRSPVI